jgi:predicted nucleotidyltransferase
MNRSKPDDKYLDNLVNILLRYEPERIILFGSRARGDADEYSDYDIIVIKRTERLFLDRLIDMVDYIVEFGRPAEILVYTPEEFQRMQDTDLGFMVQKEGIILYENTLD